MVTDHLGLRDAINGVGRLLSSWVPRFDQNRFNVTVCVLRAKGKLGKELERQFVREGHNIMFFERGRFNPLTLKDFLGVIKDQKIEVMHVHGYGASNFGRLAGIITGIPIIVHSHDDDRNYPWYQRLADLLLCKFTNRAIAASGSVRDSCIMKRNISQDRVVVMHNGIPTEKFIMPPLDEIEKEKGRWGISLTSKVVGAVARLREEKGIEYMLRGVKNVLAVFPETVFVIVGDGALREQLEVLSKKLEIEDKTLFCGYLEDVTSIMSIFDIVVMPSLTEGSPLALMEAFAMGKPIIATNVGGIKEILNDGKTGLLVPSKDPESLASKITYLLDNEQEAARLGTNAHEESKDYNISHYMRRLEKLYDEVINE